MATAVADPELNEALDGVDAALDGLDAAGVTPVDGRDAYRVVRRIEAVASRVYGHQVAVLDAIDALGLFTEDGHRSAKAMVAHGANLSAARARQRAQTQRALRQLPTVAEGLRTGRLGSSQVDRIARTFANPRVRKDLIEVEADMATAAELLPFDEFEAHLANWERLTDEDGAGEAAERNHARRNFRIHVNADGSVRIEGGCGGLQGLILREVFDRYVQDEWDADWAEARERLGDAATLDDLPRTDKQRRMDAVSAIFDDAIAHRNSDASGEGRGVQLVVDVAIDDLSYQRGADRLCGLTPEPDPRLATWWSDLADQFRDEDDAPAAAATDDSATASDAEAAPETAPEPEEPVSTVGYRCGGLDGTPLDPREVVAASLVGHVRRVVIGADSVVTDMGRRQRLFTGARQVAVRLSSTTCIWPVCDIPSPHCQSDHLEPYNGPGEGRTDPGNGAPACGTHNRHKSAAGFTVRRDRWGRFHIIRPDGSSLT